MLRPNYRGDEPCTGICVDDYYPESSNAWVNGPILRKLCSECHLLDACAEYAIHHELHGWWGGLSPRERQAIRVSRRITLTEPEWVGYAS